MDLKELQEKRKRIVREMNWAQSQVWTLENTLNDLNKEIRKASGYDEIGKTK